MRNLSLLFGALLVGCAPEASGPTEAPVSAVVNYTVQGTVPADVDADAVASELPPGGYAIVGNAATGEIALIHSEGSPTMRFASSEFSIGTAFACPDCGISVCTPGTTLNETRTMTVSLTHDRGSPDEVYNIVEFSSANFTFGSVSPTDWQTALGSDQPLTIQGLVGNCDLFSFYFDVSTESRGIFVTSTRTRGDFGGLAAADAICQARADAADLGGEWKAWLSTRTVNARQRIDHTTLPYRRVDGAIVANNFTQLVGQGGLQNAISLDENGEERVARVWTGTLDNGTNGQTPRPTCNGWTRTTGVGMAGLSIRELDKWTRWDADLDCSLFARLYCLEQDVP